jgi:hypothetical protein
MISPRELEEILDVLRDKSVTQFTCPEFSCVLGPEPVDLDATDVSTSEALKQGNQEARKPTVARGIFGHPSLWPNGVPPMFPGAERSTPTHKPTHSDEE